jgi:hypothetical protein
MVLPLDPDPARRSLARDGSGLCCVDCASADTLRALARGMTFSMARVAVGNDRNEQLRLPGVRIGLAHTGLIKMSAPGDLERHLGWLRDNHLDY